jgi:hypothetical protein
VDSRQEGTHVRAVGESKFLNYTTMGKKNDNAYHVKLKLIPNKVGYKSSFVQGIVFETSQELAVKLAKERIKEALLKEPFEIDVKVQSAHKLRKDFLFSNFTEDDGNESKTK